MSLTAVASLLQVVLTLLVAVQSNPNLPQSARDGAILTAQQVILQATTALASPPGTHFGSGTISNVQSGTGSANAKSIAFSASPTSGAAPLNVTFHSTGAIGSYRVDFGDGQSGAMAANCYSTANCDSYVVSHSYANAGTYTAKLMDLGTQCVAAGCNVVGTATITVTAASNGILSNFTATPTTGVTPLAVMFRANLQTSIPASNYSINFADGTTAAMNREALGCANTNANCGGVVGSIFASHTYASAGTYVVKLYDNLADCHPGYECAAATVTISVASNSGITLTTDKSSYNAGDTIRVTWSNPTSPGSKDWIGIVKSGQAWFSTPNVGDGKSWAWISGVSGGFANLVAPATSGYYQVVYFNNTTDGSATSSIEVARTPPFMVAGTLVAITTAQ